MANNSIYQIGHLQRKRKLRCAKNTNRRLPSKLAAANEKDGKGEEGRGGRRDEEEGGTRRKDGRGERSDAEEGAMRRVKK